MKLSILLRAGLHRPFQDASWDFLLSSSWMLKAYFFGKAIPVISARMLKEAEVFTGPYNSTE